MNPSLEKFLGDSVFIKVMNRCLEQELISFVLTTKNLQELRSNMTHNKGIIAKIISKNGVFGKGTRQLARNSSIRTRLQIYSICLTCSKKTSISDSFSD